MPNVEFSASANATPASGVLVATHTVNSAEIQVIHIGDGSGSILGTSGSPLHAALTNSPSVFVTSAIASPLFTRVGDGADTATVTAASELLVNVNNAASVIVSSGSVVVTNALSASISNTVTVAQGASGASPWGVRVLDAAGNAYGVASGSPLYTSTCLTNLAGSATGSPLFVAEVRSAGSAAGSPLFVSACITNLAGSAAGSPLFTSITNLAGSAAGSPLFTSITNLAGSAAGSPLFVSQNNMSGSVAGSPIFSSIVDGGVVYGGPSGSPLIVAGIGNQLWWAGSLLTVNSANLSASTSGCTRIVASGAGQAIVIVAATFTTSSCQFIGWVASGAGAASSLVQTPMPFGTNGGMDANRMPHGHIWQFPSGSNAVLTTTSACVVAGTIDYLMVAS